MFKLLIWALLAVVPFTSLRVICIDPPADVLTSESEVVLAEDPHCRELCARLKAAAAGSNCAITASSFVLLEATVIALPTAQTVLHVDGVAVPFNSERPQSYLAPALSRQSPPPKA